MTGNSSVQRIARLTPLDAILALIQSRVAAVAPRRAAVAQSEALRAEATRDRIRALGMEPAAEESI